MFKKLAGFTAVGGGAALTLFMSLTTSGLLQSEDLRTEAYLDPIGIPTICVGETRGVKMGDKKTEAECMEMLEERIREMDAELSKCIKVSVPTETRSAILQWAYNVGTSKACKSTLVKKLNKGDIEGACNELPKWKYAGGRVLRGLVIRREHERKLCLSGIGK